jgi:hypothetical protein
VIVVSALLAVFDVKVTYEVVEPPPVEAPLEELGGSQQPEFNAPPSYEEPEVEMCVTVAAAAALLTPVATPRT